MTATTGCTMFGTAVSAIGDHECIDEFMINHRNRVMAARAWQREKASFKDHCHLDDVKCGFMDAYAEAASGTGNGCVPPIAPRSYWGWRYQSSDGNAAVNSWFEGYPMGLKAAEQDGVANFGTIPMANLRTRTSAAPPGSSPAPGLGQDSGAAATAAGGNLIPVPGGFVNANGDFFDTNGKLIGKATVEDRVVGEAAPETPAAPTQMRDLPAGDLPVEMIDPPPTAEAIERPDDFSSNAPPSVHVAPADSGPAAFSVNLSDQLAGPDSAATRNRQEASSFDSGAYQLDDPSQEEIDAVIDDIFGKPQSSVSDDAEDTNTFESIPFTFE